MLSDIGQALVRIPEARNGHAHAIHQREVKAAGSPLPLAAIKVIEDAPGFQCPTCAAGQKHGHLISLVPVSIEEIGAAK